MKIGEVDHLTLALYRERSTDKRLYIIERTIIGKLRLPLGSSEKKSHCIGLSVTKTNAQSNEDSGMVSP